MVCKKKLALIYKHHVLSTTLIFLAPVRKVSVIVITLSFAVLLLLNLPIVNIRAFNLYLAFLALTLLNSVCAPACVC